MGNLFIKTKILLSKAVPNARRSAKLPITEEALDTSVVLELCEDAFLTDPRFCADGKREDSLITDYYKKLVSEGARVFAAYFREELVGINVISCENRSGNARENSCENVCENACENGSGNALENACEKEEFTVRNCFGVTAKKYRGTFAAAALYAGVMVKLYDEGAEILLADISEDNSASLSLHRTLGGEGFSVTG